MGDLRKINCLLLDMDHCDIVEVYGLKVWNGNKVIGLGKKEEGGFLFTGKEAGWEHDVPLTVFIKDAHVKMYTYEGDDQWVKVKQGVRFCPWCGSKRISSKKSEYSVGEYECKQCDARFFPLSL